MSKTKVKERIKMYASISLNPEVKIYKFDVYYNSKEKLWILHLDYQVTETDKETGSSIVSNHQEMECFDGKGWLKISSNFKKEDFENIISECKKSDFNTKSVRIFKKPLLLVS
jgi:hypothetical protein